MREQIGHDGDEVFGHIAKAVNGIHALIDNLEDYCDIAIVRQKRRPQSGYIKRCVPAGSIKARLHHTGRGQRRSPLSIGQCRSRRLGAGLKSFLTGWQTFRSRKDTRPGARIASEHCRTRPPGRERGAIRMISIGHPACCCVRQKPSSFMAWRHLSSPRFLLPSVASDAGERSAAACVGLAAPRALGAFQLRGKLAAQIAAVTSALPATCKSQSSSDRKQVSFPDYSVAT
jgi:hypothetical protein